jgi:hypothetical protein
MGRPAGDALTGEMMYIVNLTSVLILTIRNVNQVDTLLSFFNMGNWVRKHSKIFAYEDANRSLTGHH